MVPVTGFDLHVCFGEANIEDRLGPTLAGNTPPGRYMGMGSGPFPTKNKSHSECIHSLWD